MSTNNQNLIPCKSVLAKSATWISVSLQIPHQPLHQFNSLEKIVSHMSTYSYSQRLMINSILVYSRTLKDVYRIFKETKKVQSHLK